MFCEIYRKVVSVLAIPCYLSFFFDKDVGQAYKIGVFGKIKLMLKFKRNTRRIPSATNWLEHLRIAAEILSLPPSVEGDVIECGCFKGSSSTNLSIICGVVGRKLIICDSFEGLPDPEEADRVHYNFAARRKRLYERGQFAGRLDEVKEHIRKNGNIEVCEFVKGYFDETLPELKGTYVLAFVDVDLHKSLEDCLIHLWPLLKEGAFLFTHEAQDLPYVSKFFDKQWWNRVMGIEPPGLIGAGTGVPLGIGSGSGVGYAIKHDCMKSASIEWDSVSGF